MLVTVTVSPRFKSFCVFFCLTASAVATGLQKSSLNCMVNVKMLNVVSREVKNARLAWDLLEESSNHCLDF